MTCTLHKDEYEFSISMLLTEEIYNSEEEVEF